MNQTAFDFASRRSAVFGIKGMAAASQPLAAAAGISILSAGGSAADAAVAMAAVLSVTEPCSTGLGGDAFALYYEARSKSVFALNGSGRAPQDLTLDRALSHARNGKLPARHPDAVTVPGACAAWCDLAERFGRLRLSDLLAPAVDLAENGFPVAPLTAQQWAESESLLRSAPGGSTFLINGRAPAAGQRFYNPDLAHTLREIAEGGQAAFYRGRAARQISAAVQAQGGCLSETDLARHRSEWVEPISTTYRGRRVWECPPNGQGLAALLALNILEEFDLASYAWDHPQRLHWMLEAMRLAFLDAGAYIADPQAAPVSVSALLDKAYAARRRSLILMDRVNPALSDGKPLESSGTVYFCVVDGEGNACSFVNSNYMGFGTAIVPDGCGFSLQNRGLNFSLQPGHPNVLAPGKRPYHTIIPALATREEDHSLFAALGVMGGFMQPQGHVQVLTALVDDCLDPQAALDRPRWCIDPFTPGRADVEDGLPEVSLADLISRGHTLQRITGLARQNFGRGQIILRDPASGVLCAGSDPRADGLAVPLT